MHEQADGDKDGHRQRKNAGWDSHRQGNNVQQSRALVGQLVAAGVTGSEEDQATDRRQKQQKYVGVNEEEPTGKYPQMKEKWLQQLTREAAQMGVDYSAVIGFLTAAKRTKIAAGSTDGRWLRLLTGVETCVRLHESCKEKFNKCSVQVQQQESQIVGASTERANNRATGRRLGCGDLLKKKIQYNKNLIFQVRSERLQESLGNRERLQVQAARSLVSLIERWQSGCGMKIDWMGFPTTMRGWRESSWC